MSARPRALPARAGLAEALAVATNYPADHWGEILETGRVLSVSAAGVRYRERLGRSRILSSRVLEMPVVHATVPELWERLCSALGLLAWLDEPRRHFHCDVCVPGSSPNGPRLDASCGDAHAWREPPDVACAVLMAADPRGVVSAEQIAREWLGRETVVWRVGPRMTPSPGASPPNEQELRGMWTNIEAPRVPAESRRGWLVLDRPLPEPVAVAMLAELGYDEGEIKQRFPIAATGRFVARGESVMRHARALVATGYHLLELHPDLVVLGCPPVDAGAEGL